MAKFKVSGPGGDKKPDWLDPDNHPYDAPPEWLARLKNKQAAKKATEQEKQKSKQWYQVRIEGTAPVVVEFRVFAENEDEALKLVESGARINVYRLNRPDVNLTKMRKNRVSIKDLLTGMINWVRKF